MATQFLMGEYVSIESLCPEQKGTVFGRIVEIISLPQNEKRYIIRTAYGLLHGAYFEFELRLVRHYDGVEISLSRPDEKERKGSLIQALVFQRAAGKIKPKQTLANSALTTDQQGTDDPKIQPRKANSSSTADKAKLQTPSFQGYREKSMSMSSSPLPDAETAREQAATRVREATNEHADQVQDAQNLEYSSDEQFHPEDQDTERDGLITAEDGAKIKREYIEEAARKERLQAQPDEHVDPPQPAKLSASATEPSETNKLSHSSEFEGNFGYWTDKGRVRCPNTPEDTSSGELALASQFLNRNDLEAIEFGLRLGLPSFKTLERYKDFQACKKMYEEYVRQPFLQELSPIAWNGGDSQKLYNKWHKAAFSPRYSIKSCYIASGSNWERIVKEDGDAAERIEEMFEEGRYTDFDHFFSYAIMPALYFYLIGADCRTMFSEDIKKAVFSRRAHNYGVLHSRWAKEKDKLSRCKLPRRLFGSGKL